MVIRASEDILAGTEITDKHLATVEAGGYGLSVIKPVVFTIGFVVPERLCLLTYCRETVT